MQKVKIPQRLDPIKAAGKRTDIQGIIVRNDLSRLAEACAEIVSDAQVMLSCYRDPVGLVMIKGDGEVTVSLACQRCGDNYTHTAKVPLWFAVVRGEDDAAALPDDCEILQLDEWGEFDLLQAIEDEFIVSLPLVPRHELEDCATGSFEQSFGEIDDAEPVRENPFEILKSLTRK